MHHGARALRDALVESTARDVVVQLLKTVANSLTEPGNPPGCLAVQGALSCGEASDAIKRELCRRRSESEKTLRARLERAQVDGDLDSDADPADLARFIATVMQGMSVQAAGGASRDELLHVADMAMTAWPG